ncbi:MAG: OmpA family protein [Phocaeicola sp.]
MKSRIIALSLVLAGAATAAQAQDNNTKNPNIFVGVGVGAMSVAKSSPNLYGSISVGKYITPTWGVRAQFGAGLGTLKAENTLNGTAIENKKMGEVNLDATLNLINLFGGYKEGRAFDIYLFGGPTMNVAKTYKTSVIDPITGVLTHGDGETGLKARFGATAGLGLGYSFNSKWAMNLEGRLGVTPSIFGWDSQRRTAEGIARATVGVSYTFGRNGKSFAKPAPVTIEKEVIKEVVREVPVEVVKEVVKEVSVPTEMAIFFKINRAVISEEGMVNVKLMAKAIKASKATYKVNGFADKATGSEKINQSLSERRAQAVYDALIAEGVSASQLEKVAMGGSENMFGKNYLNRVVIMQVK